MACSVCCFSTGQYYLLFAKQFMSKKYLLLSAITAFGISGAVLTLSQPIPASAQQLLLPYPWCSVGERLHCDFMTREQCEESVDYHGFCQPNPEMPQNAPGGPRSRAR
jgi:hypothetical protein